MFLYPKALLLESVFLLVAMLFIPIAAYLDIVIFDNQLTELSLTEISQSIVLLSTCMLLYQKARSVERFKGILVLSCTLLTMMFIRESDYYLDFIYHGFWKVLAFIVFTIGVYSVIHQRLSVFSPISEVSRAKGLGYMMCGLFITIIFSRLLGTGTLWSAILPGSDIHILKSVIQESIELLGYSIIFLGALILFYDQETSN